MLQKIIRRTLLGLFVAFLLAIVLPFGVFVFRGWRKDRDLVAMLHPPKKPEIGAKVVLAPAPFGPAQAAGTLQNQGLVEASGLAASRRRDDLLWVHNDHSPKPVVYAIDLQGKDRGSFEIEGATVEDWEDIASFQLNGKAYLLIADVGDNYGWRKSVTLYVVEEPVLAGERLAPGIRIRPVWVTHFRYVDGPRDCESVAVDVKREKVLLLSKRTQPPVLYEVPLRAAGSELFVARRVATLASVPPPTREDLKRSSSLGRYVSQPTGMDLLPDGSALVVLTYKYLLYFPVHDAESWQTVLKRRPFALAAPMLRQAEAVSFSRDGSSVFITGEQRPSPLYRFDRHR